jgi:hypothetical protein
LAVDKQDINCQGKAKSTAIDTNQNKRYPLQFELPNDQWHLAVSDPPVKFLLSSTNTIKAFRRTWI